VLLGGESQAPCSLQQLPNFSTHFAHVMCSLSLLDRLSTACFLSFYHGHSLPELSQTGITSNLSGFLGSKALLEHDLSSRFRDMASQKKRNTDSSTTDYPYSLFGKSGAVLPPLNRSSISGPIQTFLFFAIPSSTSATLPA
jgi:hypothetical protein